MGEVLTKDADLECPHSGKVTIVIPPVPAPKLTISGAAALVKSDVENAAIGSPVCPQPAQTLDATVTSVTKGEADKLKVKQKGVLLADTFAGKTNKSQSLSVGPQGAGQKKLTAK